MSCDGWQGIACALERIAIESAEGPGAYEVFAEIVIPLFVGVGTLLLAVASVYVAQQSHVNQRRSNERAEALEYRAERQRIGAYARQWLLAFVSQRVGTRALEVTESPPYLYLLLGDEVSASTQPFADDFLEEIRGFVQQLPAEHTPEADAYAQELSGRALFSTRTWVRDPQDWLDTKDQRAAAFETDLEQVRAAYENAKAGSP